MNTLPVPPLAVKLAALMLMGAACEVPTVPPAITAIGVVTVVAVALVCVIPPVAIRKTLFVDETVAPVLRLMFPVAARLKPVVPGAADAPTKLTFVVALSAALPVVTAVKLTGPEAAPPITSG